MILLAFFWASFWFYNEIKNFVYGRGLELSDRRISVCLLLLLVVGGGILRYIKIDRGVANVIAVMLCALFVFNFAPDAAAVYEGNMQRAANARIGELPYEIKTDFYVDPNLPRPNIYWLHMDGMMGFSAVEQYFGDPQVELKSELNLRGFVINEDARLEASYTNLAISAMLSPFFYDSYP